jgi:hypothetical protein
MKLKRNLALAATFSLAIFIYECSSPKPRDEDAGKPTVSVKASDTVTVVKPMPLPAVVPGFKFPEDSNLIYTWLKNEDMGSIYKHAWGIWAGLTAPSGEVYQGDSLLIYETWLGISDMRAMMVAGNTQGGCDGNLFKKGRTGLALPHQFAKNRMHSRKMMGRYKKESIDSALGFWVAVAYDPSAACYATKNQIFKESVLKSYEKAGQISEIPAFPADGMTLKPTYFVAKKTDGLVRIPVWPGPNARDGGFPDSLWNAVVYADVHNKQQPGKKVKPAMPADKNPDDIAAATCNLSDFIYFNIDASMAQYMNAQDSTQGINAAAGDISILVAMHVGSKEISNWTWQSFYWAPDPSNPFDPSSTQAVSLRPALHGAAAHYAAVAAYNMVWPNQPISGGTNTGAKPIFGYNPYLEAVFSGTGPDSSFQLPSALLHGPQVGVQTNCMSCHALATYNSNPNYSYYTTDQYIDMSDKKLFNGKVKLDFAWSIQAALIQEQMKKTVSGSAKSK